MANDRQDGVVTDDFPARLARTGSFRRGVPRQVETTANGRSAMFIRSSGPEERTGLLMSLDLANETERVLLDPETLLRGDEDLPPAERARRERMRESGGGVTAYSTDDDCQHAVVVLSGSLVLVGLEPGAAAPRILPTAAGAIDPRLSPDGRWVAYVAAGALRVVATDGSGADRLFVGPGADEPNVTWGLADFVAAEELERSRGFWWAPDSTSLLVARVDESPVTIWYIADPAHPEQPAREHRYPAAGTDNAEVRLFHVRLSAGAPGGDSTTADGRADGSEPVEVHWDTATYPYLTVVHWSSLGAPLLQVLNRAQDRALVLSIDRASGQTSVLTEQVDPRWVDVVPGVPAWDYSGRLLTVAVVDQRYALCANGRAVTPPGVQVRSVGRSGPSGTLVQIQPDGAPDERHLLLVRTPSPAGGDNPAGCEELGVGASRGLHDGSLVSGDSDHGWLVLITGELPAPGELAVGVRHQVVRLARDAQVGWRAEQTITVPSLGEQPDIRPLPRAVPLHERHGSTRVLFPTGYDPSSGARVALPVLADPYGGPHGPTVLASSGVWLTSQWFADQGYAVVVTDNRGTPRDPEFERAMWRDFVNPVLEDQVAGLDAAAAAYPGCLDLNRVGVRGWSFGGYLAALAVLERPDRFHAAVAGAPVTDWALYDTAYTERYLGLPADEPDVYSATSLIPRAAALTRPLLIIHGLADDNVVVAHSLQLSTALLAAGRQHQFLPLSGVTHMASQDVVTENLLRLQLDFLNDAFKA